MYNADDSAPTDRQVSRHRPEITDVQTNLAGREARRAELETRGVE
jgi:hypothetical protein